jgi:Mce-associated membrane protein
MSSRPRTARTGATTIRRPRVAGIRSPKQAPSPEPEDNGTDTLVEEETVDVQPESETSAEETEAQRGRLSRLAVPLLAAALVLFVGLAVVFGIADAGLRGSPSARNTALVDVGATTEVTGQLSAALEAVYSYDFTRLDENERKARDVITPDFAQDFDKLFSQVRELAPQQQAVVTATVTLAAVKSIDGDRAVLVAFLDQQATRAASGDKPTQLTAAGRLTVTGQKVDGRWKIAQVVSR